MINQEALIKALKTNQIRAAGLDVMTPEPLPPDHELTTLPNCSKSHHTAILSVVDNTTCQYRAVF